MKITYFFEMSDHTYFNSMLLRAKYDECRCWASLKIPPEVLHYNSYLKCWF